MSFAAAMAGLFASPLMSAAATYTPAVGGATVGVRIILRAPDAVTEFSNARFVSATARLDCLVSDVPNLREGDHFAVGDRTYRIVGEPRRDIEQLCWSAEAAEV